MSLRSSPKPGIAATYGELLTLLGPMVLMSGIVWLVIVGIGYCKGWWL